MAQPPQAIFAVNQTFSESMTPSMLHIQEAISKNICAPDEFEEQDLTIIKSIRSSVSREGDSQLGLMLCIGLLSDFGYEPYDVMIFLNLKREEFKYKLSKYKRKSKSNDRRFLNKVRLIKNYLKLKYNAEII
jgi:hypothetical protein